MLTTDGKMHIEEKDHEDFSTIDMAGSCEYGNASFGLIPNRYISDYLKRLQMSMEDPA